MKRLKKPLIFLFAYLLIIATVSEVTVLDYAVVAEAHSGRTDANGGHRDNKNASGLGYYHYHCGGYPAHLHKNGVCPYTSGNGSSSSKSKKVKLNKTSATLTAGKSLQLKISGTSSKVTWSSSKKSVASVDSKGKVTAKKKGTATITAKAGSKKYKCKIKVKALTLNKTKTTLLVGESTSLKLDTSKKITWSSSDKSVVTVSKKGKVIAKGVGTATVTAKSGGKKYRCKVTVDPIPVSYFYLENFYLTLKEGCSEKLSYEIYPENATYKEIIWTVSDPTVARVDQNGTVTGIARGETTLTAECGGYTETCQITVETNFVEQDAVSKLTYSSYPVEHGVIVILKNNYKYAISLSMDCVFYDASNIMLGMGKDSCSMIEPGRECALYVYDPTYGTYSSYKLNFSAEDASYMIPNACNISFQSNWGMENVMVSVNNSGNTDGYTTVAIVFFKKGVPVGYECAYAIGKNDTEQFSWPYDSDYNLITPDSYKLFVNESYSYY